MFVARKSVSAAVKTCPSFRNIYRNNNLKFNFISQRWIFLREPKDSEDIKKKEEYDFVSLDGYDDPHFHQNVITAIKNPKKAVTTGITNLYGECKRYYNEQMEKIEKAHNPDISPKKNKIDMLYTFENQNDLNKFEVNTDSSYMLGYSSASLKLTQEQTAIFSGNICKDIPKDGNVKVTGYANMLTQKERLPFLRIKTYDWTEYTHLVLKIRGDGRSYLFVVNIPEKYEGLEYLQYAQPLYTRGGPYWQIAKMPFSHFYLMLKSKIVRHQGREVSFKNIQKIGITATGFQGPFKLEIEYIGLEFDELHNTVSPYESYH